MFKIVTTTTSTWWRNFKNCALTTVSILVVWKAYCGAMREGFLTFENALPSRGIVSVVLQT